MDQAIPSRIGRKVLEWVSCGPGCEKADLTLFGPAVMPGGGLPVLSTVEVDGQGVGILSVGNRIDAGNGRHTSYRYTIRLDDGQLIGLFRADSEDSPRFSYCGYGRSYSALATIASATPTGEDDGSSRSLYGFLDGATGESTWLSPWLEDGLCLTRYPIELPGRSPTLLLTCDPVGYLDGRADNFRTVSGDGNVVVSSGSTYHDLAVWSEVVDHGNSRIRAWKADGGARTLIEEMPYLTCEVAVSRTRISGIAVPPGYPCNTKVPGVRLWHSPRSDTAEGIQLTVGPVLSDSPLILYSTKGWGDFAAFQAAVDEPERDSFPVVVRLSDWKARRVVPQPGMFANYGTALTVSERYFYWGEGSSATSWGQVLTIYRHSLDQFEELGEPFPVASP
jgi:hypothetical protein